MRDAKTRRDLIAGEIAGGRDPAVLLGELKGAPSRKDTLSVWRDRYLASRMDLGEGSLGTYRVGLTAACRGLGDVDPARITWQQMAEWIAGLSKTHKPATVVLYRRQLALLLDYVGVDPNPARDKRVRSPKRVSEEVNPPTSDQFIAILDAIRDWRRRLLLIVLEQGALRIGEATSLRWGDVDRAGLRLRLSKSRTKRDKARWVYLPEWLMEALEELCPFDDRTPDRLVFQGITQGGAYKTMTGACKVAGLPHFHPHDLRHRRITIWHHAGVPMRAIAERAGHSRATLTLDVYSHVMPLDEVPEARLMAFACRSGGGPVVDSAAE